MSYDFQDAIDCPQCGFPCVHQVCYATDEVIDTCNFCGYTHTEELEGSSSSKGYGCIYYHFKDGKEETVYLKSPLSQEGINRVITRIKEECDSQSAFYLWDETKGLQCICGTMPKTLTDVYEDQCNLARALIELQFQKWCHEEDKWGLTAPL